MKITSLATEIVLLPADEPLAGAAENPDGTRPIVTLTLRTEDGIEGVGVSFFGAALTKPLRAAVDAMGALIIGDDPLRAEAIVRKLREAGGYSGPAGVFTLGLSNPFTLAYRCGRYPPPQVSHSGQALHVLDRGIPSKIALPCIPSARSISRNSQF